MNIMSYNSCSLGIDMRRIISRLCNNHRVSFLGLQEMHVSHVDLWKIKQLWGNYQFEFVVL